MAKLAALWEGRCSYGRPAQIAESESGKFFFREYRWNGYGRTWSKWKPTTPKFSTTRRVTKQGSFGTYTDEEPRDQKSIDDRVAIDFGFSVLNRVFDGLPKYRLPE